MMKKFPVTSVEDNEYLAEVYYDDYVFTGKVLAVNLFIKKEYKFLWKTKTKLVKVAEIFYGKDEEEYHDVVMAVKYCVSTYENENKKDIEQKLQHENLIKRSEKEFAEWDGKC